MAPKVNNILGFTQAPISVLGRARAGIPVEFQGQSLISEKSQGYLLYGRIALALCWNDPDLTRL